MSNEQERAAFEAAIKAAFPYVLPDYEIRRLERFWTAGRAALAAQQVPLTDRERVLLDDLIQYWQDHAAQCDSIANRKMAERQKGWDLERVALLRKLAAAPQAPAVPDASEYKRGWDECMALWADHMKRMNAALNKPLPPGWANHASHLFHNVRKALDAAPTATQPAPQAPAAPQWLPIETAPRDGTVVDLWHEEFGRTPGCHWGLPHHCCGEAGSYCDSDWHDLKEGWVDTFNDVTDPSDYTHWMPLPAAPGAAQPAPQAPRWLSSDEIDPLVEQARDAFYPADMRPHFERALVWLALSAAGVKEPT